MQMLINIGNVKVQGVDLSNCLLQVEVLRSGVRQSPLGALVKLICPMVSDHADENIRAEDIFSDPVYETQLEFQADNDFIRKEVSAYLGWSNCVFDPERVYISGYARIAKGTRFEFIFFETVQEVVEQL